MEASAVPSRAARSSGTGALVARAARRPGLDPVELACLVLLTGLAFAPLVSLLLKGRPLSGADGFLATDQLQYLTWIREAGHHVLIGNPWDLAPGERVFLHPLVLISGGLHALGLPVALAYLAWKPVAIGIVFTGALRYVRRLVPAGGARGAALVLVLFAVMPASALVAWTGWGGGPREYSFDFISGEMWTGQYLWGYLFTAIAVFAMPLILLGLERWRAGGGGALLALCAGGALFVMWLQPWQGAALVTIVWATELWRRWRAPGRPRPAWGMLALVGAAAALPALYYLWLSHTDPAWENAGIQNQAGAQDLWSWPWWAIVLTVAPLAAPAALAYRLPAPGWQDVAVRVWPLAALAVYLQPFGTFPYHSFQGLQIPLAILAVLGLGAVWPSPPRGAVLALLAVMVVPGTIHKADVFRNSVQSAGDPYWVFPGEVDLLEALEDDPRPGGVLGPTYASLLVPSRTGRETYVGPFSWTPDWERRATRANDLFEGRLTGAAARDFVRATRARWLFGDCRPLELAALERSIAPLLAGPPRRFGCATLYELRERPEMARAAGRPDA